MLALVASLLGGVVGVVGTLAVERVRSRRSMHEAKAQRLEQMADLVSKCRHLQVQAMLCTSYQELFALAMPPESQNKLITIAQIFAPEIFEATLDVSATTGNLITYLLERLKAEEPVAPEQLDRLRTDCSLALGQVIQGIHVEAEKIHKARLRGWI